MTSNNEHLEYSNRRSVLFFFVGSTLWANEILPSLSKTITTTSLGGSL